MSLKRPRSPSHSPPPLSSPNLPPQIHKSLPINDRKSTFIAAYSPTLPTKELQSLPEFADATHRISAWRTPSTQRSLNAHQQLYDLGHEDDGEKFGGKTLEKVLVGENVTGAVVVARWFGGVMLGPVRFDHMRDCAKEAISSFKAHSEANNKKRKRENDDKEERKRLVEELPQRDESIVVLRGLLAEKKGEGIGGSSSPSAKVPDYGKLPLEALRKLEKVRDATIKWILKGIEDAEKVEQKRGTSTSGVDREGD